MRVRAGSAHFVTSDLLTSGSTHADWL